MLGGRALAAALAVALLTGCATAAAQTGQRTYLPSAPLGFPAPPTAAPSPTSTAVPGRACAADRLAVRTLSDQDASLVNGMPVPRTIGELAGAASPGGLGAGTPRLARVERSTFQLQIALVQVSQLASGALALEVADPDDQS